MSAFYLADTIIIKIFYDIVAEKIAAGNDSETNVRIPQTRGDVFALYGQFRVQDQGKSKP